MAERLPRWAVETGEPLDGQAAFGLDADHVKTSTHVVEDGVASLLDRVGLQQHE